MGLQRTVPLWKLEMSESYDAWNHGLSVVASCNEGGPAALFSCRMIQKVGETRAKLCSTFGMAGWRKMTIHKKYAEFPQFSILVQLQQRSRASSGEHVVLGATTKENASRRNSEKRLIWWIFLASGNENSANDIVLKTLGGIANSVLAKYHQMMQSQSKGPTLLSD